MSAALQIRLNRLLRTLLAWAALSIATSTGAYAATDEDTVIGQWWTPGFGARADIVRCGPAICAHIVWAWDPRTTRPGQKVLTDLRLDSGRVFVGGKAYNPEDGRTYRASLSVIDGNHLLVKGCLVFLCKEQVWLRVGSTSVTPH